MDLLVWIPELFKVKVNKKLKKIRIKANWQVSLYLYLQHVYKFGLFLGFYVQVTAEYILYLSLLRANVSQSYVSKCEELPSFLFPLFLLHFLLFAESFFHYIFLLLSEYKIIPDFLMPYPVSNSLNLS